METLPFCDMGMFLKGYFPDYKIQKISVNAGFSCPNRDGTKGYGGCIYCNNSTFSPLYCIEDSNISRQINEGKSFFSHKYPAMRYLAYFQSYTGSYSDIGTVIECYEEALSSDGVEGLIVATRPDCMPDLLLDYLSDLSKDKFVLVEYGAESCNNETLRRVNRCHTWDDTVDAVRRSAAKGVLCGLHLILGLPGEEDAEILNFAESVSSLPITTLKLHQLQVIRGTVLAKEFAENPDILHVYEVEKYICLVSDFLERLRPDIVIDRFVSQSPEGLLIAPRWGLKNYEFTARLVNDMHRRGAFQGRLYGGGCM
ncbi:MAG: TIGR01212 family radical SAM protein [Bacteroidales bacterium]